LLAACSFTPGAGPAAQGDDAAIVIDAPGMHGDDAGTDAPMKQLVAAYNIHGPTVVGVDFPGTWAVDPGNICNGDVWDVTFNVTNTVDDELFRHYQYRTAGGTIDCTLGSQLAPGMYEVTLLFGEVWIGPGCSAPATQRLFDVLIEGVKVENDLNTLDEGGCCDPSAVVPGMPFKRTYVVNVSDGVVNITLDAEPNRDTMISALALFRL
jgi:hypothetical protein